MRLREKIEPIETWLTSEYYLGPEAKALKSYWRNKIIEYFRGNRREFIFSGSSRGGKTYGVCILLLRYIYEIYCIEDFPNQLFGLSTTTLPKIIFFSFSKTKADSAGVDRLIRMIDSIPWFQEPGHKRRNVSSIVSFPWIEIFSGTNISHGIGEDMLGAVIDEANIRHTAKANEVVEAERLLTEINMRSTITYSYHGVWKGFSGIISTAGSTTSFVDSQIAAAKSNGTDKFIVEVAVYDMDPDRFSKEKFSVFPGNSDVKPFVVDEPGMDTASEIMNTTGLTIEQFVKENEALLIHPPVDLKRFYLEDISYALSNLSGISQTAASSLFRKESDLNKMFNPKLIVPVSDRCPNLGIYDQLDMLQYIDENAMFQNYHGERVYSHHDISKSYDYSGYSYLYVNEETNKIQALLLSDGYQNTSIPDNEIDQEKFVYIFKQLKALGVRYGHITADQYASVYFMQQVKLDLGPSFVSHQSVDENPAAYLTVLNYAKKGMYDLYENPKLRKELWELIYDQFTGKVDHPHNNDPKLPFRVPHDRNGIVPGFYGKDVADALAGASFLIRTRENLSFEEKIVNDQVEKQQKKLGDDFYNGLETDDGFFTELLDHLEDEDNDEDDFIGSLESSLYD